MTPASVVPLVQNRRHPDYAAGSRSRPGHVRSSPEKHLLATMASATSLIAAAARIQKETADALLVLASHRDQGAGGQRLSMPGDALQQLRRVEDAIQALTSFPDSRRDWLDRQNRGRRPPDAAGQAKWPAEPLTAREGAVLRLLRGTLSLREIAQELGVSRNTVKSQVQAIYRKLHVSSRHDAVQRGRELGILASGKTQ